MTLDDRYKFILTYFAKAMPDAGTQLHWNTPFQLLVATMLSAQCTDARINKVTPALFAANPTPQSMANATTEQLLKYISSVSYPNSKSQHLVAMANMLVDRFGGNVPQTRDELMQLPGVGRKTANVMLAVAFGRPAIAVDTHVFRVANRTGLAHGKTPIEVETTLAKHIPPQLQGKAHHWLLLHGRYVCTARKPKCLECGINHWCKTYQGDAAKA